MSLVEIHDWIASPEMKKTGLYIDKNTLHTYIPVYQKLFEPYQNKNIKILEVGISTGSSLILWSKYFSNAEIHGADIQFEELKRDQLNLHTKLKLHLGDSTKKTFTETLDNYDIIIDDGSHVPEDQISTYKNLIGKLNDGGIYIIEDIDGDVSIQKIKSEIPEGQILDRRLIKGRWDDVMMIYRK